MNKMKLLIIVILMLFVASVPSVEAHSLQWGLMPHSQFEYSAHGTRSDIGTIDMNYELTIVTFSPIEEALTTSNWPRTYITAKDLSTNASIFLFESVSYVYYDRGSAVPINDWNYLNEVLQTDVPEGVELTVHENTTHWGWTVFTSHPFPTAMMMYLYNKSTGVLDYFESHSIDYPQAGNSEDIIVKRVVPQVPTPTTEEPTSTTVTTTTDITTTTTTTIQPFTTFAFLTPILIILGTIVVVGVVVKKRKKQKVDTRAPALEGAKVLVLCPFCGAKTEQGITQCWKCGAQL